MPAADRPERADAARNRRAILAATEDLLTRYRPEQISMEQVAATAGVGKGTVFHRFGSRAGLMRELMVERALAMRQDITGGPPPLGPGAPPRERLLAFVDEATAVIVRNRSQMAALEHAESTSHQPADHEAHPVYAFWHAHVAGLLTAARPGLTDPDAHAHLILAAFQSATLLHDDSPDAPARFAAALRRQITALLTAA
jgi:AcrR family transcriptional regulator